MGCRCILPFPSRRCAAAPPTGDWPAAAVQPIKSDQVRSGARVIPAARHELSQAGDVGRWLSHANEQQWKGPPQ